MALSQSVEESLNQATAALRNALAYACLCCSSGKTCSL